MDETVNRVARKILEGGRNVFFTGAGISTESGIPDYRSQGGIWDKFRPVYFDEFMRAEEARIEYWRQKSEQYKDLVKAKPNPAHLAIAKLCKMGLVESVITQNIDGLHQASGAPDDKVIELHGNTLRTRCMTCGWTESVHETQKKIESGDLAPKCQCGGYLKSDTISFGQSMPVQAMERAARLSTHCDFFMVIGSTLLVQPAASLPFYAKEAGAFLVILNLSETPCDTICNILIHSKAGEFMLKLIEKIDKCKS